MKQETKCLHSGYVPKNGEPRQMPIYQSTTFKYDSSDAMGRLFDLEDSGYFYTRLQNPSNDMTAAKIADLEGGVAAMLTSSGQAANFFALFNICETGSRPCLFLILKSLQDLLTHTVFRLLLTTLLQPLSIVSRLSGGLTLLLTQPQNIWTVTVFLSAVQLLTAATLTG